LEKTTPTPAMNMGILVDFVAEELQGDVAFGHKPDPRLSGRCPVTATEEIDRQPRVASSRLGRQDEMVQCSEFRCCVEPSRDET